MEISASAIVLKSNSENSSRAVLFDKNLGKIDTLIRFRNNKNNFFINGSLIEYEAERWRDTFIIKQSTLINIPTLDIEKIVFVHHWLETAELFLSYHQPNEKIYQLCFLLYNLDKFASVTSQKLVLAHFFTLLSVYPIESSKYTSQFFRLILGPLDTMLKAEDEPELNRELNRWLYNCLQTHPKAQWIKTLDFLKR